MMERLTKTYSDGTYGAADILPRGENSYTYKGLLLEALGKYEDAEDQGLLLRLPCKVGDTIYEVSYENREFVIKEHIVKEFIYRTYRFPRIEIYCENENGFLVCNNIGKLDECLFLTQAEAEQKLEEMAECCKLKFNA